MTGHLARARLIIGLVVLALVLAEVGLRMAGGRPRIASVGHERYGYRLLPDQVGPGGRRVNSAGFYSQVDWAPPPGDPDRSVLEGGTRGLRVAVFDSSVGVGEGVPEGASWPRQLEEGLREARPGEDVLVMNHSIGGWGTQAFTRLYHDEVEPYRPDLVIFSISDISALPVVVRGAPNSWLRPLLRRSLLYDFVQRSLLRDRGEGLVPPRSAKEARAQALFQEMYREPHSGRFDAQWAEVGEQIRTVQARQEAHGGRVLVVFAPLVQHWALGDGERRPADRPEAWAGLETIDPYPEWDASVKAWIDTAAALGADKEAVRKALDGGSGAPLAEFGTPPEFLPDDPAHWTEKGHRAIAEAVMGAMKASGG